MKKRKSNRKMTTKGGTTKCVSEFVNDCKNIKVLLC